MSSESFIIDNIGRIATIREDFEPSILRIKTINDEKRKDLLHLITHVLAISIIVIFLIVLIYQIIMRPQNVIMPDYFISIVSVVVGFYFARNLF